jgi:DNA-binding SARP family transcriptional activator/Tfp pilus assembly protein PilF
MSLRIRLLGSLRIDDESGAPSEIMNWSKGCALLAYLVVSGRPQNREALADLLWDASSTSRSLQNLRKLLSRMRRWAPELAISRKQVAYPPASSDFQALAEALASGEVMVLDEGLRLYKGALLDGFHVEGAPRFNEWLLLEREHLRRRVTTAYRRVCMAYAGQEAWPRGIDAAQRWLALDALDEQALRHLLKLLAASGQVALALQQYESSRRRLWDELGVEPEPETARLARRLTQLKGQRDGGIAWDTVIGAQLDWPERGQLSAPGSLPANAYMVYRRNDDFRGRRRTLLGLADLLLPGSGDAAQPRAVAVTGMAGVGKTQVAVEFAYRYGRFFPGGVYWLSFAQAGNVPGEVAAIGGEQGMSLYGDAAQMSLAERIGRVRRAWQHPIPRLLIFDNCEEEDLLAQWLPLTGGCRVLLTSRRARWSRNLPVSPWPLRPFNVSESEALLRQLAPHLLPQEAADLAAELGHLPLALHLAGSFLRRYRQIGPARYLQQLHDTGPLQHPSLQGRGARHSPTGHALDVSRTFAVSLAQLDPDGEIDGAARRLLAAASCFAPNKPIPRPLLLDAVLSERRDLEAILQAEDGLARLLALGFLQREEPDAVVIHRLVALFANESLEAAGEAISVVVALLVDVIAATLEQEGHLGTLPIASSHLRHVTNLALSGGRPGAVRLGRLLGRHLRDSGDYEGARDLLQQVLALSGLTHDVQDLANAWLGLARAQRSLGQDRASLESAEQAERLLRGASPDALPLLVQALQRKGWALFMLGRAREAIAAAEEAIALSKDLGSRPGMISSLNLLGEVHAYLLEQYDLAAQYLRQALAMARKERNAFAEAALLSNLGEILERQGDLAGAFELFQQALALSRQTGNRDKEMTYRLNLGRVQVLSGAFDRAVEDLEQVIAMLPQDAHLLSEAHCCLADGYLGQGRLDLALDAGREALRQARFHHKHMEMGRAWAALGRIAAELRAPVADGADDAALYDAPACFQNSLEAFAGLRLQRERAVVLRYWAQAEFSRGNRAQGEKMWLEAREIFQGLNLPLIVSRMDEAVP